MAFINTKCIICETENNSTEIYPQRLDEISTSVEVFSARRLPDRRHYRWVSCSTCGLMRSDPVLDLDLENLYQQSSFDYGSEIEGLKKTYEKVVLKGIAPQLPSGHILEIGGGNGFFLEQALKMGFDSIAGIEPSKEAVSKARADIKPFMKATMFNESSVKHDSANVIVIFHTLDHLTDPLSLLKTSLNTLKPGGKIIIAVHNTKSWSAKILRSKSPIFDIEHTFLFDRKTLVLLLHKAGFVDVGANSYWNLYSLAYLAHLLPLPRYVKNFLTKSVINLILSRIKLWFPLGNIQAVGSRPH